jgi:hypothetical protein
MATAINWAATPIIGAGILSAANAVYDGSGTLVTLVSSVSTTTLIYAWEAIATGATSASGGQIILVRMVGGTRYVVDAAMVPASITPSGTVAAARILRVRSEQNPLVLSSGDSLGAYVTVANPFHVRVYGAQP